MADLLATADIQVDPAVGSWDPQTGVTPPG